MVWRESMTETLYHEDKERQEAIEGVEIALSTPIPPPIRYDIRNRTFFIPSPKCKSDDFHRRQMAERRAAQIEEEEVGSYDTVAKTGWQVYKKILVREGTPWLAFPQEKVKFVISRIGEKPLPEENEELVTLLDKWIEAGSGYGKISPSKGFGGDKAGCRPPPEPDRYLQLPMRWELQTLERKLKNDRIEYWKEEEKLAVINLGTEHARKYVEKRLKGYKKQ